jgi:hypothetical protein
MHSNHSRQGIVAWGYIEKLMFKMLTRICDSLFVNRYVGVKARLSANINRVTSVVVLNSNGT